MRIHSLNNVIQLYKANRMETYKQNDRLSKRDSIEISSEAKEFQVALQVAKASDDVRIDRVETIKHQIEEGTYQVSNKDVADKLTECFILKRHPEVGKKEQMTWQV